MSLAKTSTKIRWSKDRLFIWGNGKCPYCGSRHIMETEITKKIRANPKPQRGSKYSCDDCGSVNTFTRKMK